MNYVCGDNRFEIIERYKNELVSATNIESSPEEMAVLDNILYRFWQRGWLKEQEKEGTWKQIDDDTNIWSCSKCDEPFILMDGTPIENKYYYCPHCGAKMGT